MVNAPSPAPSNASAKSSSRQAEEGRKQFFFEKKAAPALGEPKKNFNFRPYTSSPACRICGEGERTKVCRARHVHRVGENGYRSFANLSLRMAAIDAKANAAAAVNPAITPPLG